MESVLRPVAIVAQLNIGRQAQPYCCIIFVFFFVFFIPFYPPRSTVFLGHLVSSLSPTGLDLAADAFEPRGGAAGAEGLVS